MIERSQAKLRPASYGVSRTKLWALGASARLQVERLLIIVEQRKTNITVRGGTGDRFVAQD